MLTAWPRRSRSANVASSKRSSTQQPIGQVLEGRERVGEAPGREARRVDRLLEVDAEVDVVDQHLEHRLDLHVAAGAAEGDRAAVVATAIAGFGVSRGRLPGATPDGCAGSGRDCRPRSEGTMPEAGDDRRGRGAVGGRRRERVAPAVDDADVGGAALLRLALAAPRRRRRPRAVPAAAGRRRRAARGKPGRRALAVDRRRPRRGVLAREQPRQLDVDERRDRRSGARGRRRRAFSASTTRWT